MTGVLSDLVASLGPSGALYADKYFHKFGVRRLLKLLVFTAVVTAAVDAGIMGSYSPGLASVQLAHQLEQGANAWPSNLLVSFQDGKLRANVPLPYSKTLLSAMDMTVGITVVDSDDAAPPTEGNGYSVWAYLGPKRLRVFLGDELQDEVPYSHESFQLLVASVCADEGAPTAASKKNPGDLLKTGHAYVCSQASWRRLLDSMSRTPIVKMLLAVNPTHIMLAVGATISLSIFFGVAVLVMLLAPVQLLALRLTRHPQRDAVTYGNVVRICLHTYCASQVLFTAIQFIMPVSSTVMLLEYLLFTFSALRLAAAATYGPPVAEPAAPVAPAAAVAAAPAAPVPAVVAAPTAPAAPVATQPLLNATMSAAQQAHIYATGYAMGYMMACNRMAFANAAYVTPTMPAVATPSAAVQQQ